MDAIEMLTKQHRQMEAAFKAALDAEGAERHELFVRAADILMSHVLIEERVFFPAVKAKRTEDILLETLEEHLSLKRLLADLNEMKHDDKRFEAKLHVLHEQAEHHHKEEEEHLFPKVKKLLSDEERAELGKKMGLEQANLLEKEPRTIAGEQTEAAASLR